MDKQCNGIEDRFWAKVDKVTDPNGCWLWTAYRTKQGYGTFNINGKHHKAHRIAYWLFHGEIPLGLCILHKCDNPSCVNPSHLRQGTNADNVQDSIIKNRRANRKGELNGRAKLSESDINVIKTRINSNECQATIAKDYGVTRTQITSIKKHKTWKHLINKG